jgi:hypothetical protein
MTEMPDCRACSKTPDPPGPESTESESGVGGQTTREGRSEGLDNDRFRSALYVTLLMLYCQNSLIDDFHILRIKL